MEIDKVLAVREIKDFSLCYDGIYWIVEAKGRYPILLNPDDLVLLFQIEGLDIKVKLRELNQDKGYRFRKVILVLDETARGGDYFDTDHQSIWFVPCHVKLI